MLNTDQKRIAFIHGSWHEDIVLQALKGFKDELISRGYNPELIEVIAVPGAYEIPLQAKLLAQTGKFAAIAASGLVVDGGIYRHDFVAQAICTGLMQVQLETQIPVVTAVLTPHNFHETDEHINYFKTHFVKKGKELAYACDQAIVLKDKVSQY
ncbi:MAG: 6,7-dimethyl-8-ribityllumazine synthase [Saccharospirillaceae bacterium]|nr:6,7-dimethyl-8-ribityllumazine synthase [Pseudomonadales bacterium]NRB80177.1 6,7-dimethyl-8-ribityllumazine synthase [Saccharospirillaceae bacterium]